VQYLIEALAGLPRSFELHVVGDGRYLPPLRALADARQAARVVFHGALRDDSAELRELYKTSRIFAFTSEAENFPIVLLEAMAAGCAIVTSAGTGCAEVVGDEALLVTAGDVAMTRAALARLMNDPALCTTMGLQARQRVERLFAWESVTRRYVALLDSTKQRSPQPAGIAAPASLARPAPL
jgi:glycosyltransferase involved in cell wall biosynthesis